MIGLIVTLCTRREENLTKIHVCKQNILNLPFIYLFNIIFSRIVTFLSGMSRVQLQSDDVRLESRMKVKHVDCELVMTGKHINNSGKIFVSMYVIFMV